MDTTTTTTYNSAGSEGALPVTSHGELYLRECGRWAVFLGTVGFVISTFLVICGVLVFLLLDSPDFMHYKAYPFIGTNGSMYSGSLVAGALLYFIPSLFLYRFGVRMGKGFNSGELNYVTTGLGNLKSFFKYWGILTIIIITFYAIIFILAILGGIGLTSVSGLGI